MDRVPDFRLRRYPRWPLFALVMYAIAFILPYDERIWGWQMFLLGAYIFYLPFGWPWLANPLLWFACGLARSSQVTAFVLSCLALIASGSFAFLILGEPHANFWPGPAYFCWTASMGIALAGTTRELVRSRTLPRRDDASDHWTESAVARIPSPETPSEEYTRGPRP